jgi:hypothetical protein
MPISERTFEYEGELVTFYERPDLEYRVNTSALCRILKIQLSFDEFPGVEFYYLDAGGADSLARKHNNEKVADWISARFEELHNPTGPEALEL